MKLFVTRKIHDNPERINGDGNLIMSTYVFKDPWRSRSWITSFFFLLISKGIIKNVRNQGFIEFKKDRICEIKDH